LKLSSFKYSKLRPSNKVSWNLKTASKLEEPRFIIIGLQNGRQNTIEKDRSIFDRCILTNVKVLLLIINTSILNNTSI